MRAKNIKTKVKPTKVKPTLPEAEALKPAKPETADEKIKNLVKRMFPQNG